MKARNHSARLKYHKDRSPLRILLNQFLRWELLIILAALVCDWNSWGHQFAMDDTSKIVQNLFIQNPRNILRIFISPFDPVLLTKGHMYRPLTSFTLAVNCWIHGLNPDGFHLVNRLLHVLICLGIFWVLRHLLSNVTAAALTALLFAVHPIQTEAITYIDGRSDAQAMLFFVLAWLFHIRARLSAESHRGSLAAALLFYFFAMMSKESGVTWIGVVLLTEFVYFSKGSLTSVWDNLRNGLWKVFAGYLSAVLIYLALRAFSLRQIPRGYTVFIDNPLAHNAVAVRELTALKVLFQSLGQLLWPMHLSADYSYNQIPMITQWSSPAGLAMIALFLALLLLLAWSYFRALNIFFGLAYFLVTYSIVSNLIIHIGTIRGDRLLYMPSLGILLVFGILLAGLDRRLQRPPLKKAFRVAVAVALLLLAGRTVLRNNDWRDGMTLALQTVGTSPNSSKAHHSLGVAYFARKEYGPAVEQYRIAESIYAEDAMLLNDLGIALSRLGKTEEAIQYYRRAVDLAPMYPVIRFNLALALRSQGDSTGARLQDQAIIAFYDDLIRKDPSNADHHYYKANALYFQGQLDEALSEYKQTLQIDPHYTDARKSIDLIERKMAAPRTPK
ncbi:MAG: tetratricopeptide repeat protein [Acidobacteriia bacterium]|nr:tetratricopeptide repeat protein [Terriglobia bacterium]